MVELGRHNFRKVYKRNFVLSWEWEGNEKQKNSKKVCVTLTYALMYA